MSLSKYDSTFVQHHVTSYPCSFLTFTANDEHLKAGGDESKFWVDGFINVTTMRKIPKYIGSYRVKRSTCHRWWVTDLDGVNVGNNIAAVSSAYFEIN